MSGPFIHKRDNRDVFTVCVLPAPQEPESETEAPDGPADDFWLRFRYEEAASGKAFEVSRSRAELRLIPLFGFDPAAILVVCTRSPDEYDTKEGDAVTVKWMEAVASRPHQIVVRLPYAKPEGLSAEAAEQADLVRSFKNKVDALEMLMAQMRGTMDETQKELRGLREFVVGVRTMMSAVYSETTDPRHLEAMSLMRAPRVLTGGARWSIVNSLLDGPADRLKTYISYGLDPNQPMDTNDGSIKGQELPLEIVLRKFAYKLSQAHTEGCIRDVTETSGIQVRLLLAAKADPHKRNNDGSSLISRCAQHSTNNDKWLMSIAQPTASNFNAIAIHALKAASIKQIQTLLE